MENETREIKVRAWDKKAKKYAKNLSYNFMHDAVRHSESTRFVFEQYTGLKDINGKEIYEGDIIQKHFEYKNDNELIDDIRYLPSYNLRKSLIIGNKFKNPELDLHQ